MLINALRCVGAIFASLSLASGPSPMQTTTSLNPSFPVIAGQPLTLTAVVKPASGTTMPTGTVTLSSPDHPGPTLTLPLDEAGKLVWKGMTPPAGIYTLVATYNGAPGFSKSVSTVAFAQVDPNTEVLGDVDYVAAGVSPQGIYARITGHVVARSGSSIVNAGTVSATGYGKAAKVSDGAFSIVIDLGPVASVGYSIIPLEYSGSGKLNPSSGFATLVVDEAH